MAEEAFTKAEEARTRAEEAFTKAEEARPWPKRPLPDLRRSTPILPNQIGITLRTEYCQKLGGGGGRGPDSQ